MTIGRCGLTCHRATAEEEEEEEEENIGVAKWLRRRCLRKAGESSLPAVLRRRSGAKSVETHRSRHFGVVCSLLPLAVPCGATWRLCMQICSGIAAAVEAGGWGRLLVEVGISHFSKSAFTPPSCLDGVQGLPFHRKCEFTLQEV